jgi:hypothetical protein
MSENSAEKNIVLKKDDLESLVLTIAELKTAARRAKTVNLLALVMTSLFVIGLGVWLFNQLTSPHITFISEGETKTLIGVKDSGRIQANKDDRTGETIIEVYHAKK